MKHIQYICFFACKCWHWTPCLPNYWGKHQKTLFHCIILTFFIAFSPAILVHCEHWYSTSHCYSKQHLQSHIHFLFITAGRQLQYFYLQTDCDNCLLCAQPQTQQWTFLDFLCCLQPYYPSATLSSNRLKV